MKTIKLSEKEFKILKLHWWRNLDFGVGGTFGDGEELYEKELEVGKGILEKLRKL